LTAGHQLDTVIRQHLWLGGFDYPGIETGHGVSHGLGTIRGGASISSTKTGDTFGLKEGMTISIGISTLIEIDTQVLVFTCHLSSAFD
jgi:Xaa-Pro aminopeptidase